MEVPGIESASRRHSHERTDEEEDYSDDFFLAEGSNDQPTAAEGSCPRPGNRAKTQRHAKKSKRGAGKQGSRKNTANYVGARCTESSNNSGPGKFRDSKHEKELESRKQKLKLQQLVSPSSVFQSAVPDHQSLELSRELNHTLKQLRMAQKENAKLREVINASMNADRIAGQSNMIQDLRRQLKEARSSSKSLKDLCRRQKLDIAELEQSQEEYPEKMRSMIKASRELKERLNELTVQHREDERRERIQHDKIISMQRQNQSMRDIIKKTHGFNFGGASFHDKQQEQQKRANEAKEMEKLRKRANELTMSLASEQRRTRKQEKKNAAATLMLHDEIARLRQMLHDKQREIQQSHRRVESLRRLQHGKKLTGTSKQSSQRLHIPDAAANSDMIDKTEALSASENDDDEHDDDVPRDSNQEMMNLVAEISASISVEAFANARDEADRCNRAHRGEAGTEPTDKLVEALQQQPPPQIETSQPLPLIAAKSDSDHNLICP